ncbi:inactive Ufm1-specific protease 1 [Zootoca vivipara]|uniref:inactive Ufm1-specific protease 1 n=1 Tax=Zootoca vivipara TaxID=8524 RepID=UPI00293BB7A8|nr:inactive Ufm1-specific protease 1 [Zootoca vivipara]
MSLLSNVHLGLPLPDPPPHCLALVSGSYRYYHYGCDGVDDRGWGCGYRTLQTVCSWLPPGVDETLPRSVPSLQEIQSALVEIGDKPASFAGSRDWIGTVEAALCLDHFYSVPGKLVHVPHGRDLERQLEALQAHFQGGGGPVMMGGDKDNSSKGLLGVCSSPGGRHHLLVLDPHHYGRAGSLTREELQAKGWVCWRELGLFEAGSFYNLCFPQFRAKGCPV